MTRADNSARCTDLPARGGHSEHLTLCRHQHDWPAAILYCWQMGDWCLVTNGADGGGKGQWHTSFKRTLKAEDRQLQYVGYSTTLSSTIKGAERLLDNSGIGWSHLSSTDRQTHCLWDSLAVREALLADIRCCPQSGNIEIPRSAPSDCNSISSEHKTWQGGEINCLGETGAVNGPCWILQPWTPLSIAWSGQMLRWKDVRDPCLFRITQRIPAELLKTESPFRETYSSGAFVGKTFCCRKKALFDLK